jgi:integrase
VEAAGAPLYARLVLPAPMLARPDRLPRGDYSYEVKWDGFRAIVSTEDGLQVRSRRGWSMSDRVPEDEVRPVAFGGRPTSRSGASEPCRFRLDAHVRRIMARKATGQIIERERATDTFFGVRFAAYGKPRYVGLGGKREGWTREKAEEELANTLADVRRGIWRPRLTEPAPVVEALGEPTFHVLASEWVQRRQEAVDARTVEHWKWALSNHLLPFFAELPPSRIDAALVERYKAAKLNERPERLAAIERWQKTPTATRGRKPLAPLSNSSINKTLKVLAQVLDDAVEFGYTSTNPARGKRRRLKADRPKRTWLELHEIQVLLDSAGKHRLLLATMAFAGLRVGELVVLCWRDVDLTAAKLRVEDSKTEAGERLVDLIPLLLKGLAERRLATSFDGHDHFVFATGRGTRRNRSNIARQILAPAIERANVRLIAAGRPPLGGVTNHSLRRTFASLLYEAGATPAYVMAQMGHTDSALALEVYTKVMERKRDTSDRMEALIQGVDYAPTRTRELEAPLAVASQENEKPPFAAAS